MSFGRHFVFPLVASHVATLALPVDPILQQASTLHDPILQEAMAHARSQAQATHQAQAVVLAHTQAHSNAMAQVQARSQELASATSKLDSVQQFARLPRDEVDRIFRLLQSWSWKTTCSRRDLESLIGSLHHAYRVVISGRTFLRRMIDLLCCFWHRNHPIRLNAEFRRDLHWWLSFFQE
jgi:cell fate (sporulation/competence/biofilm development) regulator YmcA (YheA/YmcA/DUF963 family)